MSIYHGKVTPYSLCSKSEILRVAVLERKGTMPLFLLTNFYNTFHINIISFRNLQPLFHKAFRPSEVLDNLQSIHGALLRMNRSIQAEVTFGIMKYDRWYKWIVRRGPDCVRLKIFPVSIGHNLYKYHNQQMRLREVA